MGETPSNRPEESPDAKVKADILQKLQGLKDSIKPDEQSPEAIKSKFDELFTAAKAISERTDLSPAAKQMLQEIVGAEGNATAAAMMMALADAGDKNFEGCDPAWIQENSTFVDDEIAVIQQVAIPEVAAEGENPLQDVLSSATEGVSGIVRGGLESLSGMLPEGMWKHPSFVTMLEKNGNSKVAVLAGLLFALGKWLKWDENGFFMTQLKEVMNSKENSEEGGAKAPTEYVAAPEASDDEEFLAKYGQEYPHLGIVSLSDEVEQPFAHFDADSSKWSVSLPSTGGVEAAHEEHNSFLLSLQTLSTAGISYCEVDRSLPADPPTVELSTTALYICDGLSSEALNAIQSVQGATDTPVRFSWDAAKNEWIKSANENSPSVPGDAQQVATLKGSDEAPVVAREKQSAPKKNPLPKAVPFKNLVEGVPFGPYQKVQVNPTGNPYHILVKDSDGAEHKWRLVGKRKSADGARLSIDQKTYWNNDSLMLSVTGETTVAFVPVSKTIPNRYSKEDTLSLLAQLTDDGTKQIPLSDKNGEDTGVDLELV